MRSRPRTRRRSRTPPGSVAGTSAGSRRTWQRGGVRPKVLPQDLRTVKLIADDSGPEVDTDEPAGIESAVALARARRKLVGIDPEPVMVGRYRIVERLG